MMEVENEKWKSYYLNTKEKNYNIEYLDSLKSNKSNLVYNYILRCLSILDSMKVSSEAYYYVSETLKWSDISKCGSKSDRKTWKELGYPLNVHNIASSLIYVKDNKDYDEVVRVLIETHGLVGQYIRGEINLKNNYPIYELITKKLISKELLLEVLLVLNKCVIGAVNEGLYESIESEVKDTVNKIVNGDFEDNMDLFDRLKRLNKNLIDKPDILNNNKVSELLDKVFNNVELWYYEVALNDFTIEEQIKMLLIISKYITTDIRHLTFVDVMKSIYLDYDGKKRINLYKKRVIEGMLNEISFEDIINDNIKYNSHVKCVIKNNKGTLKFNFVFSIPATKLIEFCEVAYTSNSVYNKAVYMLYDLFGFRRDKYDRFYNEINYLYIMNSTMSNKKVLLDYIVGKNVLDVGPGGGALMDLIEEDVNDYNVFGIDISENVIDELTKKKARENRRWSIVKGDALTLENYFEKGSIDTIIYSSIIHELYSYIPFNGKKFNIDTVKSALKSAYNIIPKGGRIIIRDGIKTEPENEMRIIKFNNKEDMKILDRYCHDFEGRHVTYEKISEDTVKMLVNDAMEFLYTYTWGENSYSLEVKEQFGYLTPSEYVKLIEENLIGAKVLMCHAFLQDGYEENLLNKISIYDENMNVVKLPNSTCITVIEKG